MDLLCYCCLLCYYSIYLFVNFAKQHFAKQHALYSSGIVYSCLSSKPFYVQCLFDCSVIVSSPFAPLVSFRNCPLFFSEFLTFVFSDFKTISL